MTRGYAKRDEALCPSSSDGLYSLLLGQFCFDRFSPVSYSPVFLDVPSGEPQKKSLGVEVNFASVFSYLLLD